MSHKLIGLTVYHFGNKKLHPTILPKSLDI